MAETILASDQPDDMNLKTGFAAYMQFIEAAESFFDLAQAELDQLRSTDTVKLEFLLRAFKNEYTVFDHSHSEEDMDRFFNAQDAQKGGAA